MNLENMSHEELARKFHEVYERLAPEYGYETRDESAVEWDKVPESNRNLMIATIAKIRSRLQPEPSEDIAGLLERANGDASILIDDLIDDLAFDLHPIGKPKTENQKGFHRGANVCIKAINEIQPQLRAAIANLQAENAELAEDRKLLEWFITNFWSDDLDCNYDLDTNEFSLFACRADGKHLYKGKTPREAIKKAIEADK